MGQKKPACSAGGGALLRKFSVRACLAVFLLAMAAGVCPAQPLVPVVVLDPGHGGGDQGAALANGVWEKDWSLGMARRVQGVLDGRAKVVLTREDDYAVDAPARASTANHFQAALLVSFHAGNTWPGGNAGVEARVVFQDGRTQAGDGQVSDSLARPWHQLQRGHGQASSRLADLAAHSLARAGIRTRTTGLPLAVLSGVDAPAIMLDLSPVMARKAADPAYAQEVARAVGEAVREFLDAP